MKGLKTAAIIVLCVLCVTAGALADDIVKDITAQLRPDFTIEIDGEVKTFADVNGKTVYPVLYEGTTYLPIRAIGNIMGKDVQWDQEAKKVTLSNPIQRNEQENAVLATVNEYIAACKSADFDKAGTLRSDGISFREMKTQYDEILDDSMFANNKEEAWRIVYAYLNRMTASLSFEYANIQKDNDGYKVYGKLTALDAENLRNILNDHLTIILSDNKVAELVPVWLEAGKLNENSTEEEITGVVRAYVIDEFVNIINNYNVNAQPIDVMYNVINKDGRWVLDMAGNAPGNIMISE